MKDFFDIIEYFVAPRAFHLAGLEAQGQLFPLLLQDGLELLHVGRSVVFCSLVGLGKDDAERHAVLAQPLHEVEVNFLGRDVAVDQQEKIVHHLPSQDVLPNHALEALLFRLRALGKSVAGQVYEKPLAVNQKMIDENGLARLVGGHRQLLVLRQKVDKAAFTHVAAADESKFRLLCLGAFFQRGATAEILGFLDFHEAKVVLFLQGKQK